MKINTKIRYALRMLLLLAEQEGVMNTTELGKQMLVSPKYLRKLAGPLERSHLIKSVQGIYGGYSLNKEVGDISLQDLFEAYNEEIKLSECANGGKCPLFDECRARPVWQKLEEKITTEFNTIKLIDILSGHPKN